MRWETKGSSRALLMNLQGYPSISFSLIILILYFSLYTFLVVMLAQIYADIIAMFGFGSITRDIQNKASVVRVGLRRTY